MFAAGCRKLQAGSLCSPECPLSRGARFIMKDIYDILREFKQRRGQSFALATLVRAEGSSYRRPGARMLVCEDGRTVGSLSAGCIEDEVALCAREVLWIGIFTTMMFDTPRRFGCTGTIHIFIDSVSG